MFILTIFVSSLQLFITFVNFYVSFMLEKKLKKFLNLINGI